MTPWAYRPHPLHRSVSQRDVDVSQVRCDPGSITTTPNLAYITPNLYHHCLFASLEEIFRLPLLRHRADARSEPVRPGFLRC
jgi:hypothetical protein